MAPAIGGDTARRSLAQQYVLWTDLGGQWADRITNEKALASKDFLMGDEGLEATVLHSEKPGKSQELGISGCASGDKACPIVAEISRLVAMQPTESRELILLLVRQIAVAPHRAVLGSTAAPIPTKQATAHNLPPSASPTEQEAIA